jgi:hypothetical protein
MSERLKNQKFREGLVILLLGILGFAPVAVRLDMQMVAGYD